MKEELFDKMDRFFDNFSIKMDELRESQKETDRQMKETDKKMEETDKQMKETDRKLENLNKKMEGFFGNYSQATEELFYRSLEDKKRLGNIKFDAIDRRVSRTDNHTEYDILLFNGDCVGIIEVKSKAHPKELKNLIDKKIKHFKIDYPDYSNHKFYFGIASLITNKDLIEEAREEGIFLLTQKGDHLEIVNSEVKEF